ncbi:MAG: hypothetical protein ACQXXL_07050 [Candidatus Methanosuratincola sp.]|nr:hypothetical protein [Candidatus Methanosuratincola sp.]
MGGRDQALKLLLAAVACGIMAAIATGSVRNDPEVGLPELRHYGYPLAWLVTDMNGPAKYAFANFALDTAFWVTVSFAVLAWARKVLHAA